MYQSSVAGRTEMNDGKREQRRNWVWNRPFIHVAASASGPSKTPDPFEFPLPTPLNFPFEFPPDPFEFPPFEFPLYGTIYGIGSIHVAYPMAFAHLWALNRIRGWKTVAGKWYATL